MSKPGIVQPWWGCKLRNSSLVRNIVVRELVNRKVELLSLASKEKESFLGNQEDMKVRVREDKGFGSMQRSLLHI